MEFLLIEGLRPFSVLAGFILILLVLEIGLLLVGMSSNVEIDGAEVDGFGDFDVDAKGAVTDLLTPEELSLLDMPPAEREGAIVPRKPSLFKRLLRLIGIGRGPLLVSLTCLAAGVSATGFLLQLGLQSITGSMLGGGLALALAIVPGLLLGGRMAALAARIVPQFESHAISGNTYHGRHGEVVIGVASQGSPAQVRWRDSYGTTHSLMAEPLRDGEEIAAGSKVLIVKTRERQPRIVVLS